MVDITPPVPAGAQIVEAYGDGGFRICGTLYDGSVLILPGVTLRWQAASADAITMESLAPILEADAVVELLLIGCGDAIAPLSATLRAGLRTRGVAVEPMDTGAACRTFNVLLSEDRAVAAALIAV
ncbi:MAG: hypothetical protein GEU92_08905 [Alphaproteobacteria bacterium]|nr:hypothetical protein [Alphaproteobacteria bacterium]